MGGSQKQKNWQSQAIDYARENGWKVLPIHPGKLSEEEKEQTNEVCAQLGYALFNGCKKGTSEVAEIKEWTGMPGALIGVHTGLGSNLTALEVPTGENAPLSPRERRRVKERLPDTRVVEEFRGREYFLFRCSEPLGFDGLRRSDGLILHGQGSIIPLPGPPWRRRRRFTWRLDAGPSDESHHLPALPDWVRSLFGVSKSLESALSEEEKRKDGEEGMNKQSASQLPTQADPASPPSPWKGMSLPFQSGDDLRISTSSKEPLPYSWLKKGALSLLTGPSKTSGKSTFVANLAVHVAAGRLFLGKEPDARPVILLSDFPPRRLQTIIAEIGVGKEALSRLQVLHTQDVTQTDWRSLLETVYDHASRDEAALVIIDSLDQFVEAKCGLDPTTSDKVSFLLTAKLPQEAATLAVKASPVGAAEPMSKTIERLGLLGRNADLVARLDAPPTDSSYPTLRRLQFRGRLGDVPSHLLCEMIRDRYQMLKKGSLRGVQSYGRGTENRNPPLELGDGRMQRGESIQLETSERQAKLGFPSDQSTNDSVE